jgi:beta-lactamase regulating signal transducer with metallopeptidase domain
MSWLWWMIAWGLWAMLLGLATALLLRLFQLSRPVVERAAWMCVLVAACMMPLVVSAARAAVPDTAARTLDAAVGSASLALPFAVEPPIAEDLTTALAILWMLVSGILMLRVAAGAIGVSNLWRRARRLDRTCVPESEHVLTVRESSEIAAPLTVGGGVLLPHDWRAWSPATVRAVLRHEGGHVRRHDFWWQLLATLHTTVFWWSPFSWWLRHRLARLCEALSDDEAIMTGIAPTQYAELLVAFTARKAYIGPAIPMARETALAHRVDRVLAGPPPLPTLQRHDRIRLVALAAPVLVAAFVGAWRPIGPAVDAYVLVLEGERRVVMSGSMTDVDAARALAPRFAGDFLWFRRGADHYVVTHASHVRRARALFRSTLAGAASGAPPSVARSREELDAANARTRAMHALILDAERGGLARDLE